MRRDKLSKQNIVLYCFGVIPVVWIALLTAPYIDGGLFEFVKGFGTAMGDPFHITLCEGTPKTILLMLAVYGFALAIYLSNDRNYRRREEHGSAKWGVPERVNKKYAEPEKTQNKILTQNVAIGFDGRKHRRNLNTLVIGGTGAGKTRFFAKPNIMNTNTSFVVLDPKGELLASTGNLLEQHGYDIRVLDMVNPERSHCYNPFV